MWYIIKTSNEKNFKKFCKKVFKKYKIWTPPEDVYKYTFFLETKEQIPETKHYCFIKFTKESYKELAENDCKSIQIDCEEGSFKIGKHVKVVSPFFSFSAKVIKIGKNIIKVKGIVDGKELVLSVPLEYIR